MAQYETFKETKKKKTFYVSFPISFHVQNREGSMREFIIHNLGLNSAMGHDYITKYPPL